MSGREFFSVRTLAQARAGFRPRRRTAVESVTLTDALRRAPAVDVHSPEDLPGFARSTVDGYAVRAADTYGASEGLPSYLDVAGSVRMGAAAQVTVAPGRCVAVPTGGALPDGADAVVMVEHTAQAMPGTIEVNRPVAPGSGVVSADEDVAAGAVLIRAGRPVRSADLGLLAAAGVTELPVHARPRVEIVPPSRRELTPGQIRDATSSALVGLIQEAGGTAVQAGIVADDPGALVEALRDALDHADLIVISAGSSVGARDETATAVAELGELWCHGLAIKPGKPTLLAHCGDVPVIGLPGNPLSALVVFRLLGIPLIHDLTGCDVPPTEPTLRTRLARDVPSAAGRLDVVQVRLTDGGAEPVHGPSALLRVLTTADGYLLVPEPATGLAAGTEVEVVLYR
jgi:molybdopterin molybdotransferase